MIARLKLDVVPALPEPDRKSLTTYVAGLRKNRAGYFINCGGKFWFDYRGSRVTIHVPKGFKP